MPSIEYSGMKITGGKVFAILTLLSALGGAAWTGFTFYQDYLDMKEKIVTYTEPDLSGFDKKLALIESETNAKVEILIQKDCYGRVRKHKINKTIPALVDL